MGHAAPPASDRHRLPRSSSDAKRQGTRCHFTGRRCSVDMLLLGGRPLAPARSAAGCTHRSRRISESGGRAGAPRTRRDVQASVGVGHRMPILSRTSTTSCIQCPDATLGPKVWPCSTGGDKPVA
jgi:hypothetical protein